MVLGFSAPVIVNNEKTFHIICPDVTKIGSIKLIITAPSGKVIEALIEQTSCGFKVRFVPSEIGDYSIEIWLGNAPVSESPFQLKSVPKPKKINRKGSTDSMMSSLGKSKNSKLLEPQATEKAPPKIQKTLPRSGSIPTKDLILSEYMSADAEPQTPADPLKVRAYGDGLLHSIAFQPAFFNIDTRGAGLGDIDLQIEGPGPRETKIQTFDNGDGTCNVSYLPTMAGIYKISVLFGDSHIQCSPYFVHCSAAAVATAKTRTTTNIPMPAELRQAYSRPLNAGSLM